MTQPEQGTTQHTMQAPTLSHMVTTMFTRHPKPQEPRTRLIPRYVIVNTLTVFFSVITALVTIAVLHQNVRVVS